MYVENMVNSTQQQKKRRSIPGCISIPAIIVGFIVICILPFFALSYAIGWFGEGTRPVPGDASAFDPIASYDAVAKYAGDNVKLQSINVYYVRSDGTMDLNASYNPYVEYEFYHELASPPANAPPVGAGGSANQKWYEVIRVRIRQAHGWHVKSNNSEYDYYDFGMSHDTQTPTSSVQTSIPAPTCSLKRLWSAAMENGAPKDAVARVEYNENGYEFTISDISIRMKFDNDCRPTK